MATHFFGSAFFGGEFFSEEAVVAETAAVGGAGGRYRYFTPERPKIKGKLKRRIDKAVEQEAKLKTALIEYQTTGVDMAVLNSIAKQLQQLQLLILRLALESQKAEEYITWKRAQEDEDIKFILSIL